MKKEDIKIIKDGIKTLNMIEFPQDLHKSENRAYKQVKHAIAHLKQILPKEKVEE